MAMRASGVVLVLGLAMAASAFAGEAPSRPAVDAPMLAQLGHYPVGVRTITFVQKDQLNVLAFDPASGKAPKRDRIVKVELWYPCQVTADASPVTYSGSFPAEPPAPPTQFTIPGSAVRDAPMWVPNGQKRFPLVIVSHGYSNPAVAMSWLGENLASKDYIVAAIHHDDPPITDRSKFPELLLRRPLDIAFVAESLHRILDEGGTVDPSRTALIGYSMGGYGVLTVAGGELDPKSPLAQMVPGNLLSPYAQGGNSRHALHIANLKAIVALAPAGGSLGAWGKEGLRGIAVPMLLIAGDRDMSVDYQSGARSFFETATNSQRYLLTFLGAGHRIGLGPAPEEMRKRLWDQDWFEDPVWRSERIVGINLHMITAFLDRYVLGDESRARFLDGLVPRSSDGVWPASVKLYGYDAYSHGRDGVTVWPGFKRGHAEGLELLHEAPD